MNLELILNLITLQIKTFLIKQAKSLNHKLKYNKYTAKTPTTKAI